jgi:hypothetical protein
MKLQLNKIYPENLGNMYWYLNTPSPEERMTLKMWKQVKPLILDRLCFVSFRGVITSRIRKKSMKVIIQIVGFHRLLSFVKQTIAGGRTTSRQATPLGDGRGVPKHFRDFGRFSKCSSKCSSAFSQPTLLEGFALRSRKLLSVFSSSDPAGTVSVLLVRGTDSSATLIRTDITNMAQEELSSVDSLFSLVESMDFDPQMEDLMTEAELVANLPDDFFSRDPIPLAPSSTPPPSFLPPQTSPPSPLLRLSTTSTTAPLQLRQVGPNTFEVVTDALQLPLDTPLLDQGYGSLPSAVSSSSSIPPPSPPPDVEIREERRLRLQADACRRHRQNKKRKLEEEQLEFEQLERKNVELRAKFKAMEEMVARLRCTVMEVVTGKRKRGGEEESDERVESKSRRI